MINVQNLQFTYPKSKALAVRDLVFQVAPGEVFGFLGPSGSGKSTTQKVLIGLLEGYRGDVQVLNKDRADWTADDYERIGVSFELPNHFAKLTAAENLDYFAALYQRDTRPPEAVLDAVGLKRDLNTPIEQFSKGMKNRMSVARSLLHNPDLLFLDEPTAGLDPTNAMRIKDLIRAEQSAGRTVFLTTHDMSVADELCDHVAFIVDGQIKQIDTPRQLKLDHGERTVRVEYAEQDQLIHQDFPLDDLGNNAVFQTLIKSAPIQTIHSREASLADVFIKVTGRDLASGSEG